MKEIEVKFRVADKQAVIEALQKSGVELGDEYFQDDTSYRPTGYERGQSNINVPFLRIRREAKQTILTMKKPVENQLDRIEHETIIEEGDQMGMIIEDIGFKQDARVKKHRRKTQHKGYEICVDSVEGLGDFIEIEKLVGDDEDGVAAQAEIRKFLISLLGNDDWLEEVDRGYDVLINE